MSKKGRSYIGIIVIMVIMLMAGCSKKKADYATDMAVQNSSLTSGSSDKGFNDGKAEPESPQEALGDSSFDTSSEIMKNEEEQISSTNSNQSKKLIWRYTLDMETREFTKLISSIDQNVKQIGGYIEQSQISGTSYEYRNMQYAYLIARIPKDKAEEFVKNIGELANVINENSSVEDVTLQYVDIESHKTALKVEQNRLLELLKKAEKMEDIITIETRLSQIRYEIQNYESQLRVYDNQVDYTTVTMSINEVERINVVDNENVWDEIQTGFGDTIYNIAQGFKNFFIWFVVNLPYLIIWAVIIAICAIIIKKYLKASSRKYGPKHQTPSNDHEIEQFDKKE